MKIAVLTSGGVDSSVALMLLKKQKHDLTAFYLKIWLEDELSFLGNCPWEEDIKYIQTICQREQIPLSIISLQKEYWHTVVSYTINELSHGHTPNPDILCNLKIKFGHFYEQIDSSFQKIATGHYAQLVSKKHLFYLKESPDEIKDQTYFLAHLSQNQLNRALFPIGHLTKKEVRKLAEKFDLPNKNRKDSQGICFLGKLKFHDFVSHHLGQKKGDLIESETQKKIASHPGYWFYTVGQRKGIGLSGGPWYVVKKDLKKNIVYISKNYHSMAYPKNQFQLKNLHWITEKPPKKTRLFVKLRHGPRKYPCEIQFLDKSSLTVKIKGKDQGLAPGQFAVFYDKTICLGTGVIV